MSDRPMFSSSSLQTFTAASFVLALLATGMGFYNYTLTNNAMGASLDLQAGAARSSQAGDTHIAESIAALTARVDAAEARLAAAEAAMPPAATE